MPRKSRNFQGCWTCRSRKVKCDLAKPHCSRCIKANFKCAGYDIKLCWSDPMSIDQDNELTTIQDPNGKVSDESSYQRRNIQAVPFPKNLKFTTFKQVDNALEQVEAWIGTGEYKKGPFTVFRITRKIKAAASIIATVSQIEKPVSLSLGKHSLHEQNIQNLTFQKLKLQKQHLLLVAVLKQNLIEEPTSSSLIHSELLDYAKLTILAIKGINFNFDEQNILHILYPKFYPNMDSDDWEANMKILNRLFKFTSSSNGSSPTTSSTSTPYITVFPLFNHLLHCFKSNGSNFMRMPYPKNYWDKIIIPFIYKIFGEFLYLELNVTTTRRHDDENDDSVRSLEEKISQIKGCIVYSVLCLASFQQRKDDVEFLNLSIELRKLTITILNSHLDEYGEEDDDDDDENEDDKEDELEYEELLLLGILLQLQIDNYFSVFENYDYLYGIGEFLIKEKFSKQLASNTLNLTSYLIGLFGYYHTFYESTQSINVFNYKLNEEELKEIYRDIEDDYNLFDNYDENDSEPMKNKLITKPIISNLITPNNDNISFTINFRGSSADGTPEPPTKKTSTTKLQSYFKYSSASTNSNTPIPSKFPYTPKPSEMGYNQFNSELIYLLFGIPQSLMEMFNKIIQLTNHKNVFLQRKVFPRNFPKICADMEDSLMTWDETNYWTLLNEDQQFILDFHKGLYHNIKSFHHSLIVYFNQLIKKLPTKTFQNHINLTLDHIKELSDLNKKSVHKFKPSFWQVLICATDSLDDKVRERFESIWLTNEFNECSNYWRAKQIIYEVWKRRDDGEEVTWMDMVREWEVVMSLA